MLWRIREFLEQTRDLALHHLVVPITARKKTLPSEIRDWKIQFIGASVGYAWRLDVVFGIEPSKIYAFDKTALVDDAISEGVDCVIIKECAAYFPDNGVDKALYLGWLDKLQQAGIAVVIATVVPVTKADADRHPGRADGIAAFNDWLREIAKDRGLALLDLERALRVSDEDRLLKAGLDNGDGLHLRPSTYRAYLDHLVVPALMQAYENRQR
jgi:hypothetical protein